MQVYICGKCRELEEAVFNNESGDMIIVNDELPNLTLKEMMGEGESRKVQMLCQECNAGKVSDFKKHLLKNTLNDNDKYPTPEELAIASFSQYNFVTLYDHPEGCLSKDMSNKRFGYKLNPPAIGIYNQMMMYAIENNIKNVTMKQHPLYTKWVAEGEDFDINEIINFTGDIGKHIRETRLNGGKVAEMNTDDDLQRLMDRMPKEKKHWKEEQSEEEKAKMLKKAELKRVIKELKKSLNNAEDKQSVLQELEVKREELKNV